MNDETEAVRALLQMHREQDAVVRATRALAADPHQRDLLALCSIAHLRLGDYQHAFEVASGGCRTFPDDDRLHQLRGAALSGLGRHRDAVDAIAEAIRLAPNVASHRQALAGAWLRYAQRIPVDGPERDDAVQRAATAAVEARELAPYDAASHFARAEVYAFQGDWASARACAREGLAIDPNDPRGHELSGIAAAASKEFRVAGDHFVAAAKADPRSSHGAEMLRRIRARSVYWITAAVLLLVPLLAWLDGTWSNNLWIVVAGGLFVAGWLLFDTSGRLSDEAKAMRRQARRLR